MLIKTPNNFIQERMYIINEIFSNFLQLNISILIDNSIDHYIIFLSNGSELHIEDHFFYSNNSSDIYCKKNIPVTINFIKNKFIIEEDIPIIFGTEYFNVTNIKIHCGIDIFASCFFMLTRWEEFVLTKFDNHERFQAGSSLAKKFNFLHRPIVNEYVEMLWEMLFFLDNSIVRRSHLFKIVPTHDVDFIRPGNHLKLFLGDILKRKSIKLGFQRLHFLFKNEFNTFEWLMTESEKVEIKSRFYFMTKGQTIYDGNYDVTDLLLKKIISLIKKRGHVIGFHPSYNTSNDSDLFSIEKDKLERKFNLNLKEGRQHYLRFSVPHTWQIWEDNNMDFDSTLSFAEIEGFRCGTSLPFKAFNILSKETLKLVEKPLILMDVTLRYYRKLDHNEVKKICLYYKNICMKYNIPLSILFHNNSFTEIEWPGWKDIYRYLLSPI